MLFLLVTRILCQISNVPIVGSAPQIPYTDLSVYSFMESIVAQNTTETVGPNGITYFFSSLNQFPELVNILKSQDAIVFIPSNTAMMPYMSNTSKERLERMIAYHIVPSRIDITIQRQYLVTQKGEMLILVSQVNAFLVEFANTITAATLRTKTKNGLVFTLENNGLLIPSPSFMETLQMNQFTRFMEMIHVANLTTMFESLRDVSIHFPLNSAFEYDGVNRTDTEWARILLHHITSRVLKSQMTGKTLTLQTGIGSTVTSINQDLLFSNYTIKSGNRMGVNVVQFEIIGSFGIGYTIDSLLIPDPSNVPPTYTQPPPVLSSATNLKLGFLLFPLLLL